MAIDREELRRRAQQARQQLMYRPDTSAPQPASRRVITYIPDDQMSAQPSATIAPSAGRRPISYIPDEPPAGALTDEQKALIKVPDMREVASRFQATSADSAPEKTKPKSKGVAAAMAGDLGELLNHLTFGAAEPLTKRFENYIADENTATKVEPGQLDPKKQEIAKTVSGLIGDLGAGGAAYKGAKALVGPLTGRLPGLIERAAAPVANRLSPTLGAAARVGAQQAGKVAGVAATGAAAGTLFQAPREVSEAVYGTNDQTIGQRLGDVGVAAGLGVVGDPIIQAYGESIGPALKNLISRRKAVPPEADEAANAALNAQPARPLGVAYGTLRPASNESYINKVMTDIKPIVTERMTPPLENPNELAKWLRPHLGDVSLNEIRKLPYEDMRQLAEEVRGSLSTYDIAKTAARERGYDLDQLLNNQTPNLKQTADRLRMGAVAGAIEPPRGNVRVATTRPAPAAAPAESAADAAIRSLDDQFSPSTASAAAPPQQVAGFKTSKGSTYTVDAKGSTQRTKTQHAGHDPKDVGLKNPSERTVYVDKDQASLIGTHGSLNSAAKPRVVLQDDGLVLVSFNSKTGQWGRHGEKIPFTTTPAVGKAPIEFWGLKQDGTLGDYATRYHAGNDIVEITGAGSPAGAPQEVEQMVQQYTDADQVMKELDQRYSSGNAEMAPDDLQRYVEAANTKSSLAERIQRFINTGSEDVQPMMRAGAAANREAAPAAEVQAMATPAAGGQAAGGGTPAPLPPGGGAGSGSPAPAVGTKTISRTQLTENIKKKLDVTIDTGRMGVSKQQVAGIYKVQPEVIRTGTQGDYDTIAHEIGHHFTKQFNLKQQPALERELTHMMDVQKVHDYKQYPQAQWFDEGIAEYFRTYLSNPAQARQLAPQFSAFLDGVLPKKLKAGLVSVQKDIRTWIDQGDYNQAKGMIDFDSGSRQKTFSWSKWYTRFVDDLHPLEMLEKALTGTVKTGKDSIYKLARLSRGVAERAKMAVTRGVYDDAGNKLSDGLSKIIKPLEQVGMKESDLATYLAVKHAIDLLRMGKETPFTPNQMAEVMQRWDSIPEVKQVHADIMKYNDALLKILQDAGIISAQSVRDMKAKYPNYVPFFRHFDDDTIAGFKGGGGFGGGDAFANITMPLRKMTEEGSDRTLINPIESMVKNTFLAMQTASKNKVGLQLAELAKIDGAGAWVEHVPGQKSGREHIVDVYKDGKKEAYKIRDPELYNAMLSLDTESTNSLIKFLGGAASMLRAGATLTPEFMVRNAFRDVAGAMINSSKYGFNPVDFFKGLFHVLGKTETFDRFISSGGAMSTMMSLDRDTNREALEAVFKLSLKDKTMNVITDPKELAKWLTLVRPVQKTVGALRKGAEISELSTKVGAFNKSLKKTADADEAAYTARDLMDFNRAGSAIRQANRAVAFLNASIQGTDKMARAFKENPAGFLVRAFTTLVLPATAIYYHNKYNLSEEDRAKYDNIPQWQKDTFYVIGIPGTGEFVRIPKPFEAGMLFATGTERSLRWLEDNDPEAFKAYGRATLEAYTPPMLFTALTPLLEAITNHSFFRNAPVVPMGEERFEKKDQYGVYTSELAKDIGSFMDQVGLGKTNFASPRIIDNTIKGYTAGLGQYGVDLADEGIKAVTGREITPLPKKKITEQPIARSFFASTAGGGQIRDEFYTRWDQLSKEKASASFNEEPFENQKEYNRMNTYHKQITKLNKQYKEIQKSKTIDSESKRSQLDALDDKMNVAAQKALGK